MRKSATRDNIIHFSFRFRIVCGDRFRVLGVMGKFINTIDSGVLGRRRINSTGVNLRLDEDGVNTRYDRLRCIYSIEICDDEK